MTFNIEEFGQWEPKEKTPVELQQYLAILEKARLDGESIVAELNNRIAAASEPNAVNKMIYVSPDGMQRFFDLMITPKTKAWGRISELLSDAQSDPVISNNPEALEFLSIMKTLSDGAWGHWDLQRVFQPIVAHISSETASNAANKKNEPNRVSKQKVFDWCDENMNRFKSMEDAAHDIAETFIPQKYRTVRVWMTEWKKLRSASRPHS